LDKRTNRRRKLGQRIYAGLHAHLFNSTSTSPQIYYVSDKREWSTKDDARNIVENLRGQTYFNISLAHSVKRITNSIVHFGSLPLTASGLATPWANYNKIVSTIFHGNYGIGEPQIENHLDVVLSHSTQVRAFVVSCTFMKDRLIGWGIPSVKIHQIPLGVNLGLASIENSATKHDLRHAHGISNGEFCIGSWQKDGQGWDDGDQPKLIKGPDVLVETLIRLSRSGIKVVALLSGPARGFVINTLSRAGVRYIHRNFDSRMELYKYMSMADACLVTSREEGGPKAILEAMAHGVPVVSTKVGMAPDVITNNVNGILCDQEDVSSLCGSLIRLHAETGYSERIASEARKRIVDFSWPKIAERYLSDVYKPLFEKSS
jgi:glycosyltransferase involved in cell wall biosynthesis